MARAYEKCSQEKRNADVAAQRYAERVGGAGGVGGEGGAAGEAGGVWRPDLGQRLSDYHLGLLTHIGNSRRPLPLTPLVW